MGAPVFAQMEVTCGDYSVMDNAKQMETIAALESETSQMASEQNLLREDLVDGEPEIAHFAAVCFG